MEFFTKTNYNFLQYRHHAIVLSLIVIGAGIISLIVKGGPNYGIDFSGGALVDVCLEQDNVDVGAVRAALVGIIPESSTIQAAKPDIIGAELTCGGTEILIRTPMTSEANKTDDEIEREVEETSDKVEAKLAETFGEISIIRKEMVGPKVGQELRSSAVWSVLGALAGILIYITFRFQFWYALGAVAALLHDVLVTLGMFSLFDRQIDLPVIGALLTIVGYSLNDTIVIFDRVRENLGQRAYRDMPFFDLLNMTLNQTLSRTILTSVTVLIVAFCLYFFGGAVINDFAFALLIGVLAGTYSTVFIASALVLRRFGSQPQVQARKVKATR